MVHNFPRVAGRESLAPPLPPHVLFWRIFAPPWPWPVALRCYFTTPPGRVFLRPGENLRPPNCPHCPRCFLRAPAALPGGIVSPFPAVAIAPGGVPLAPCPLPPLPLPPVNQSINRSDQISPAIWGVLSCYLTGALPAESGTLPAAIITPVQILQPLTGGSILLGWQLTGGQPAGVHPNCICCNMEQTTVHFLHTNESRKKIMRF